MADPLWLADVLRAEGLKVVEHEGWQQRGHGDFGDIRGVLCHHTAGGGENDWRIVQFGRPDLEGPLAQLVLERDGTYRVIAAGVCWHAGRGSHPGWPTNNANYHVIGIEGVNNGVGQPWPEVQLDAYKRGVAAILRHLRRGANDCVAHREYSSEGKIDPTGIDMNAFRRDVQKIIDKEAVMSLADDELGKRFPSRSKYRRDDKPVDTLAGLILNIDARIHEEHVEREALKGVGWAVALVRREADKGDDGAEAVLTQIEGGTK